MGNATGVDAVMECCSVPGFQNADKRVMMTMKRDRDVMNAWACLVCRCVPEGMAGPSPRAAMP